MRSREQLEKDFRALGVAANDIVMLHASVRAVGDVAGGPDQIHLALKGVLTTEGALIMYASCPRYYDEVGRGHLTKELEEEILEKLPAFDPLAARSDRDHGTLVEFLRTYPGSRVNPHVARFVVWGKHSDHLISDQPWNYAFGAESLLDRFLGLDPIARVRSRRGHFPSLCGACGPDSWQAHRALSGTRRGTWPPRVASHGGV